MRVLRLCSVAIVLAACAPGGEYVKGERGGAAGGVDRGETNGRMFDFISNLPDGEDWQIRLRDNSLWAAYSEGDDVTDLGTKALSDKDANKLWALIDEVDIAGRKKGRPDEDEGWVELRLREPGDANHDIFKIFVSRADAADDDEVLSLAEHLQKLVEKYFKKKPEF